MSLDSNMTTTTASQIGDDEKSQAPSEPITSPPPPAKVCALKRFSYELASSEEEVGSIKVKLAELASSVEEVGSTFLHGVSVNRTLGFLNQSFDNLLNELSTDLNYFKVVDNS